MIIQVIIVSFSVFISFCSAVFAQSSEKPQSEEPKKEFAVFTSVYNNNQGLGTLYRFRKNTAVSFQFFFNTDQQNKTVLNQGPCDMVLCSYEKRTYGLKVFLHWNSFRKTIFFHLFRWDTVPDTGFSILKTLRCHTMIVWVDSLMTEITMNISITDIQVL